MKAPASGRVLKPNVPPWPLIATVMAQNSGGSHSLQVLIRNWGGGMTSTAQVGEAGPNDALRVRQKPLPSRGTAGLVVFPHGDSRACIWLCSLPSNLQNAYTSDASSPFIDYEADFSGGWRLRGGDGSYSDVFPDGTSITISPTGVPPQTYRNTATPNGPQTRVPFAQSDRIANAPSSFVYKVAMASGAYFEIDQTGAVTMNAETAMMFTASSISLSSSAVELMLAAQAVLTGNMLVNGQVTVTGSVTAAHFITA